MPKEPKTEGNGAAEPAGDSASGLTIELARKGAIHDPAPWLYEGTITRGALKIAVSAQILGDGAVEVLAAKHADSGESESMQNTDESALRERVRLLLRACYRQAMSEGLSAPPRKIVRWREERV